jgi:RHS repeat-associated protein
LLAVSGPLPGSSITFTYDSLSRVRTKTDESGYTLAFERDDLDRLTKITFPDGTFHELIYTTLDLTVIRDRAGRQTTFEYNSVRQMVKRTDPLNRATLFQWCKCGALKALTDPLGRTTIWRHDIQGRVKCKEYADGSKVTYLYESSAPRLRQRIDEQLQTTQYSYNRDNTLSGITYTNATVPTPSVAFAYDANYSRLRSMTDGAGEIRYRYIPINAKLSLGAGQLASVDGPQPDDSITFDYDQLGRRVTTVVNGAASSVAYDAAGRIISAANALGAFDCVYDGNSSRKISESYPNGQVAEFGYAGVLEDQHLQRIANKLGVKPVSEFTYVRDVPTGQITSWIQQTGRETPAVYELAHDQADQLTSASLSAGGLATGSFTYSYDPVGNRLTEQIDDAILRFSYNALNELTSVEGDTGPAATYQWDAEHRLASVSSGNQSTEFAYDGFGRRIAIRQLVDGAEVTNRRFLWCENDICEERAAGGAVSKRFFSQGVKVESGVNAGEYFYSRDHLDSIRELTDDSGSVRATYSYDPFGRRSRVSGDLEADFGFAGMFWSAEADLHLTRFRAYDSSIGRWLSRDPLEDAESEEGPNLYAYVLNNPVGANDPLGLCCEKQAEALTKAEEAQAKCMQDATKAHLSPQKILSVCRKYIRATDAASNALIECEKKPCTPSCPPAPNPNPLPPPPPPPPNA